MYRLIIADDEKYIREGLKYIVDWESLGFTVTEVFQDGQEVLEFLDYMIPDVLLLDIKMSYISGLDVAKYVYEQRLPCKIVLVSGYCEFELARQGLKYGVDEFLTKPTEMQTLERLFKELKIQLDDERKRREKHEVNSQRMEMAVQFLEERFFSDIVMGVTDSKDYIDNCMGILYPNINVGTGKCFLADLYIEAYLLFMEHVWEHGVDQLEDSLREFMRNYQGAYSYHIVYKTDNLIEVFGILCGEDCENMCALNERDALNALMVELEQYFNFKLSGYVRQTYKNIYQIGTHKYRSKSDETDGSFLEEQKKIIITNVLLGNILTARTVFHRVLWEIVELPIEKRNLIISNILQGILSITEKANNTTATFWQLKLEELRSTQDIKEMECWLDRIFDRIKLSSQHEEFKGNTLIEKAKHYIHDNIYKDISQEETANYLYVSQSYLSRLFRKQTGESFLQYVTRIKMEKAIELLKEPQYKTYQIGEKLGYKTPRYFAKLFRSHTGMNPSEYRRNVLHLGGKYEE